MLATAKLDFARPSRSTLFWLVFLLFSLAANAQSLYTAEVELDRSLNQPRTAAYELALQDVLFRVSGSSLSSNPGLIRQIFPDPAAYVVSFRPGNDSTLFVSFDGDAIESRLREAGQPVWGGDRPTTLIWMAVDWGDGERQLIGANDSDDRLLPNPQSRPRQRLLRERVLDLAERRGLPVLLPLLDAEDLRSVTFADVWGGFDERLMYASQRYGADSVLIGRIRADGSQLNRWTYYFGGDQLSWTGEAETVVSLVADRLAAEFSIGGDEPLRQVSLSVAGVSSLEAYGSLKRLLERISVIESLSLAGVDGDRLSYRVSAYGGASRLARALRLAGLIEEERINVEGIIDDAFIEQLDFYYSP